MFACVACGKTYLRKSSLQRHVAVECGQEPRCYCPLCPYRSKQRCSLLRHLRAVHLLHAQANAAASAANVQMSAQLPPPPPYPCTDFAMPHPS